MYSQSEIPSLDPIVPNNDPQLIEDVNPEPKTEEIIDPITGENIEDEDEDDLIDEDDEDEDEDEDDLDSDDDDDEDETDSSD